MKLFLTRYMFVVIILFNTGFYISAFLSILFGKFVFLLWLWCYHYRLYKPCVTIVDIGAKCTEICFQFIKAISKSSRSQMLFKIADLQQFAIFTGQEKHPCWSLFLINLQGLRPATLSKRDSNTSAFLWILRNF